MLGRRRFLTALGVATITARGHDRLAIEGGPPVRSKRLEPRYYGPLYYDNLERTLLLEVLKTGSPFRWWGSNGYEPDKCFHFEQEYARFVGTRYALGVTSGTAALQTALAGLGIGPGDEVILPAWTWHSCFNTVVLAGALPVLAEIDESFNIDPDDIEHRITRNTRVIMTVHLLGCPADMDRILPIARRHNLKILEDCAQCVGGSYKGKKVGSIGDVGIYSFQLNKTITAGEGGAVVTSDPVIFERAFRFHDLGGIRPQFEKWYDRPKLEWFIGTNYRMSELTGAVLLAQVRKLDCIVADLRRRAQLVYDGIRDLPGIRFRYLPDPGGELGVGVFIGFENKRQRDRFIEAMRAENVPARPPWGSVYLPGWKHIQNKVTVHPRWPSFQSERGQQISYRPEDYPKTQQILDRFAGVGLDPKYTDQDVKDIIVAIRKVYPKVAG